MPYSKSTKRNYGDSPLDATKNGGHSPYKMNGHTLPGINQRSEGNTDLADGRYKPSAFTKSSPAKNEETKNHPMMGTVNDKGTRVVDEKGNWVGVGDRPDLVKPKKEATTKESSN